MAIYAQIIKGKIHWIGEPEIIPEDKAGGEFIDLTDADPMPKEGWRYSSKDKTFSEPPTEVYIDVTKINQHEINRMILKKLGYKVLDS